MASPSVRTIPSAAMVCGLFFFVTFFFSFRFFLTEKCFGHFLDCRSPHLSCYVPAISQARSSGTQLPPYLSRVLLTL
jgi:hypothetical protein